MRETTVLMEDFERNLEDMYIQEFLRNQGYDLATVLKLPTSDARRVLSGASAYAAVKLTEVDARARVIHDLHGVLQTG